MRYPILYYSNLFFAKELYCLGKKFLKFLSPNKNFPCKTVVLKMIKIL